MSDEKQIEKFDPSQLMEGVKNRIKATFVSLIPDAQWEQMCDAEMKKFFEKQPVYGYNQRIESYKPSQFEELVTGLMKDKCKEYLTEMFSKPEYQTSKIWESRTVGGGEVVKLSEHLDTMIKEKMPEMLQTMFTSILSGAFYQLFNQAQSQLRSY